MSDDTEGPAAFETDRAQPSAAVKREFWVLVAVFNTALLALAVGVLLLAFTGRTGAGFVLAGLGAGLGGYGLRRYRRRKA